MPCCGERKENNEGNEVDKQLEIDALTSKLKFKLLLLGAGESGKSTVLKQLKLIQKITMPPEEIKLCADSLKTNAAECMTLLLEQAAAFGYTFDNEDDKSKATSISQFDVSSQSVSTELGESIKKLWTTEIIQKTYARRTEFWILDSAEYYLENIERFIQDDFTPSEEDLIMARVMTTGIITTDIPVVPLTFTVVDVGGQRNERRKWIHCFSDVNGILFIVNLAGYNTVLFEDRNMNRMEEAFILFKQTVNNPVFSDTPIYLVFNKKDLFEKMLEKDKITSCKVFNDYAGEHDFQDVLKYISAKFKDQITTGNTDRLQIFHIAARFKRDVKTTWDDIIRNIKERNKKSIDAALKGLEKYNQANSSSK